MAQIYRPIAEYKDVILSTGITLDNCSPPKKTIKRFIRLLKQVDEPRLTGMLIYPLHEILLIAFLAVLANASGWNEIADFGTAKKKWLKKFLVLENGIPSHDTFRRVFALVDTSKLEQATVLFLSENMDRLKKSLNIKKGSNSKKLICVDGKEQRGTGRKYGQEDEIKNLQTLHVFDASNGICLVSKPIAEKTNEIPTAQEVLRSMQLKDAILTFDALNTQKKTIAIIAKQKGDYVGALKENHATFFNDVTTYFSEEQKTIIKKQSKDYYETTEKAHSQIEIRRYYLTTSIQWFEDKKDWKKLRGFLCYEKKVYNTITKKETTEIRYYITSMKDVLLCAEAVRGHWSVENQLHWHLDVNFGEDDNTTSDKNAFNNLSVMNKLCLSLLKLAQPLMNNSSIRGLKKRFSWEIEDSLSTLLNVFDEDVILNALENAKIK